MPQPMARSAELNPSEHATDIAMTLTLTSTLIAMTTEASLQR